MTFYRPHDLVRSVRLFLILDSDIMGENEAICLPLPKVFKDKVGKIQV